MKYYSLWYGINIGGGSIVYQQSLPLKRQRRLLLNVEFVS